MGVGLRLVGHDSAREGAREDGLDGGREAGLELGFFSEVTAAGQTGGYPGS